MFTSNIGRLRFFFYSLSLFIAEAVAVVLCIAGTIGFAGLINSMPGPSRQGLAGAALIVSLIFVALRGNIAWRRCRDAMDRAGSCGPISSFPASMASCRQARF
ncbi:hypothetical protein [Mesorhizobium silamurunense]|uniref:hypothetical protein n=1 Tax=Mesorhizobium silamurunense TaxID=499528 RepID=UPI001786CA7F|nr:hypothetical protein [Mesorhizobium silamurunense]